MEEKGEENNNNNNNHNTSQVLWVGSEAGLGLDGLGWIGSGSGTTTGGEDEWSLYLSKGVGGCCFGKMTYGSVVTLAYLIEVGMIGSHNVCVSVCVCVCV